MELILASATVSPLFPKGTFLQPVGPFEVDVAARCLQSIREVGPSLDMIGKPDDVSTRDVAERTQLPDLNDDGAVIVSTECCHASPTS